MRKIVNIEDILKVISEIKIGESVSFSMTDVVLTKNEHGRICFEHNLVDDDSICRLLDYVVYRHINNGGGTPLVMNIEATKEVVAINYTNDTDDLSYLLRNAEDNIENTRQMITKLKRKNKIDTITSIIHSTVIVSALISGAVYYFYRKK